MLHRKKLLAIALATAAGLPALVQAQTSNVVLYGKLYPEMIWGHATGGSAAGTSLATLSVAPSPGDSVNQYSLQASNSRIGVRGTEQLNSDLRAIFQIESRVDADTGGSTLASRNTFVGLESKSWGTVKLGFFDTVYKEIGDSLSMFGISSGNFVSNSSTLSKIPLGDNSSGSFHLRRGNSVLYETPDFRGLKVMAQYSPDEAKTSTRNADLISLGVQYESGPLYLALAGEQHRDFFGGSRNSRSSFSNFSDPNARSKDRAVRGTAKYRFGNTTVEGDIAHLEWKERGGAVGKFESYKHNTYLVAVDHRMGGWRLGASFSWGQDGSCSLIGGADCSTDGLDGKQINIGAMYTLSRRTQVFAIATRLDNGKSARISNADWTDTVPGMDITQVALGIAHTF